MSVYTDDNSLPADSAMIRWIVLKAIENLGKEMNIAPKLKSLMEETGFVNVSDKIYKVQKPSPGLSQKISNSDLRANFEIYTMEHARFV